MGNVTVAGKNQTRGRGDKRQTRSRQGRARQRRKLVVVASIIVLAV